MNNSIRGSSIVYQSLSFKMINELLKNEHTPAWIKIWLYFSILKKYGRRIFATNKYISDKLNIPLGTVKYSIARLRDEGLIEILNSGTWSREIKLTMVANINETENKQLSKDNEYAYHSIYGRTLYKEHIYLTESEYSSLSDMVNDTQELETYLNGMNTYLSNAVIKYASHYNLLFIWIDKNKQQVKNKKKKYDTPDYKWYLEQEREYIVKQQKEQKEQELDDLIYYDWLNDPDDIMSR